ncbi:MAG TPA: oxidoreductase [Flavipsychrobacter sp.]
MKKIILVTGASSGMGKDFALQLLKEGHMVYGAARRTDKMKDIVAAGGRALAMDVTDVATVEVVVNTIIKEQGRIDVLVNNAGFATYGAVEDVTIDEARYQFEVNIFGLASVTQKVLPYMRGKRSGTIINISSVGGKIYTPLGSWYHATKHALEGWSDCLRLELKQFGINVVLIEPGIINTEFIDVMNEPLRKRSQGGAYEDMAMQVMKSGEEMYKKPGSYSMPSVISKLVSEAVSSSAPKTRYAGGKLAKPMIFLRWLLSDRMFDKLIMSQLK